MRGVATSPGPASLLYFRGIPEAAGVTSLGPPGRWGEPRKMVASRGRVVELPLSLPSRLTGVCWEHAALA